MRQSVLQRLLHCVREFEKGHSAYAVLDLYPEEDLGDTYGTRIDKLCNPDVNGNDQERGRHDPCCQGWLHTTTAGISINPGTTVRPAILL